MKFTKMVRRLLMDVLHMKDFPREENYTTRITYKGYVAEVSMAWPPKTKRRIVVVIEVPD